MIAPSHFRLRRSFAGLSLAAALCLFFTIAPLRGQTPPPSGQTPAAGRGQFRPPDFDKMAADQAETDKTWRDAAKGYMQVEKITYRSSVGDMDIPALVFQPLKLRGPKGHPALVWVHENIRGHLYEHYIPYIREATAKGYIVIAPEYRGSIGYGKAFYDAIDYGGNEVDDVVTAVDVLKTKYPAGRSGAHRDHRLEPRRHDHAALDHAESDDVQGGGGDGAGDESVSAARVEGRRAAASGDRSGEPLRRAAVREARDLQGSLAALQRGQAADSALRRRDAQRRGREHRGRRCSWSTRCARASRFWRRR